VQNFIPDSIREQIAGLSSCSSGCLSRLPRLAWPIHNEIRLWLCDP